jgi:hypothetical protein
LSKTFIATPAPALDGTVIHKTYEQRIHSRADDSKFYSQYSVNGGSVRQQMPFQAIDSINLIGIAVDREVRQLDCHLPNPPGSRQFVEKAPPFTRI